MSDGSTNGLADVAYWGRHAEAVYAEFGGDRLGSPERPRGWLDLPLDEAEAKAEALRTWAKSRTGKIGLMVACDEHIDFYRLQRAGWSHPLHVGAMDVAGCGILGIEWDQGDHSMRHRGERRFGQAYPVTLERTEWRKNGLAMDDPAVRRRARITTVPAERERTRIRGLHLTLRKVSCFGAWGLRSASGGSATSRPRRG
ncbi:hypothetical protein [Actinospica robiniae]|uniref:hypothetical protein n=1 Tax=Actinospica robiniae TaxID=304901 RepID=UPI001B7FC49E|nr:hypothetical protein [Actinospica robiniae]